MHFHESPPESAQLEFHAPSTGTLLCSGDHDSWNSGQGTQGVMGDFIVGKRRSVECGLTRMLQQPSSFSSDTQTWLFYYQCQFDARCDPGILKKGSDAEVLLLDGGGWAWRSKLVECKISWHCVLFWEASADQKRRP